MFAIKNSLLQRLDPIKCIKGFQMRKIRYDLKLDFPKKTTNLHLAHDVALNTFWFLQNADSQKNLGKPTEAMGALTPKLGVFVVG